MNDRWNKRLVIAFIRNVPQLWWVDWKFKTDGTPAAERLFGILFDPETEGLRDLTSEDVRDQVIECVLEHENLFEIVLREAQELLEKGREPERDEKEEEQSIPPDFRYKCGLKPGERVRLVKDLPIQNHKGEQTHVHPAGEVWTVLGPSSDPSVLWLRQADGEPHTWDDEEGIFEQFCRVADSGTLAE